MTKVLRGGFLLAAVVAVSSGCNSSTLSRFDAGGGAASRTVVTIRASRGGVAAAAEIGPAAEATVGSTEPGALKGQVLFEGTVPKLLPLVAKAASKVDPSVCAHEFDIPDESLIVSESGGLANVFIYLDKAPDWYTGQVVAGPGLDQLVCIFRPHALIAPVGVPFSLKNSDTVSHNVATSPSVNTAQNEVMPPRSTMTMSFKRPEKTPFQSSCKIHPWMDFYTLTLNHPFSAVTDADGRYEITGLRPGKYKFRVWHERGKNLETVTTEIKGGESRNLPLKYARDRFGL